MCSLLNASLLHLVEGLLTIKLVLKDYLAIRLHRNLIVCLKFSLNIISELFSFFKIL